MLRVPALASFRKENRVRYLSFSPAQELTSRKSISSCIVVLRDRDVNFVAIVVVVVIVGLMN